MAQMTEYELQKAYLQERKKALRASIKLETVKVKTEVTQVGKLAGMGLSEWEHSGVWRDWLFAKRL